MLVCSTPSRFASRLRPGLCTVPASSIQRVWKFPIASPVSYTSLAVSFSPGCYRRCNFWDPDRRRRNPAVNAAQKEDVKPSRLKERTVSLRESLPPEGIILMLSCIVGLLTGLSVVIFNDVVHTIHDVLWDGVPEEGAAWLRLQPLEVTWQRTLLVPVGGGLAVGLMNAVRDLLTGPGKEKWPALRNAKQVLAPIVKAMAAATTLGSGSSLGPEGPSVEIGASIAAGVGKLLRNSRERRLGLIAAGSAAGIASGFNAAVAGCFFSVESVLRSSTGEATASLTTAMILLSSVLASVVTQAGLGSDPAFRVPAYEFRSAGELPLYLLLGLLCGGVSIFLTRSTALATQGFESLQKNTNFPVVLLPPLGGLCVGVIALAYPEVLYWGFANVDILLESRPLVQAPSAMLLLQLVGAKVVATALCRGAGLVGGVYAPSLFVGAALGSAYGRLASAAVASLGPGGHSTWLIVAAPQAYALVGMAATLAGVCQVPLTAVLLLFELTRDYRIILPLMAAVGIASWTASVDSKKTFDAGSVVKSISGLARAATPDEQTVASSGQFDVYTSTVDAGAVNARVQYESEDGLCQLDVSLCLADEEMREEELLQVITVGAAMRSEFARVERGATVGQAVAQMLEHRDWCCLVLSPDGCLEGLLTLADVQLEAQGMAAAAALGSLTSMEQLPVAVVCSSRPSRLVTASPLLSLRAAQRLMTPRGLRQLPVVSTDQRVIGLLSRDDINLACRAEATRRLLVRRPVPLGMDGSSRT